MKLNLITTSLLSVLTISSSLAANIDRAAPYFKSSWGETENYSIDTSLYKYKLGEETSLRKGKTSLTVNGKKAYIQPFCNIMSDINYNAKNESHKIYDMVIRAYQTEGNVEDMESSYRFNATFRAEDVLLDKGLAVDHTSNVYWSMREQIAKEAFPDCISENNCRTSTKINKLHIDLDRDAVTVKMKIQRENKYLPRVDFIASEKDVVLKCGFETGINPVSRGILNKKQKAKFQF